VIKELRKQMKEEARERYLRLCENGWEIHNVLVDSLEVLRKRNKGLYSRAIKVIKTINEEAK
jgi:hypothetical protein